MHKTKRLSITLVSLLTLLASVLHAESSENLDKGIAAFEKKKWDIARNYLLPLAETGNSEAQFRIGNLYRNGYGFNKDFTQAVDWYRKAAISGHAKAQTYFAMNLELGRGITKDLDEASKWYRRSANQGDPDAQHWMATASLTGNGLKRDLEASYLWHILALEQDPECGRLLYGLDEVSDQLTLQQIQALDKRINDWRVNNKQGTLLK